MTVKIFSSIATCHNHPNFTVEESRVNISDHFGFFKLKELSVEILVQLNKDVYDQNSLAGKQRSVPLFTT